MSGRKTIDQHLRRVATTGTLLVLALALSGCAAATRPSTPDAFSSNSRPPAVRILVRNMNFSDVRLFALRQTGRESIGTVAGKQDREFQLDWPSPERLSIEINMLAGPKCVTEELQVDPGDLLQLEIAVNFEQTVGCR